MESIGLLTILSTLYVWNCILAEKVLFDDGLWHENPPFFTPCYIFMQGNKNDINQGTWRLFLRLRTILSTDCVQNFDACNAACFALPATFLCIDLMSFKINSLIEFLGFAHNLVHSKCAELCNY